MNGRHWPIYPVRANRLTRFRSLALAWRARPYVRFTASQNGANDCDATSRRMSRLSFARYHPLIERAPLPARKSKLIEFTVKDSEEEVRFRLGCSAAQKVWRSDRGSPLPEASSYAADINGGKHRDTGTLINTRSIDQYL